MLGGGTNFYSPSYDPANRLFIVTARETCATYHSYNEAFKDGERYAGGGGGERLRDHVNYGALRAIDPTTGDRKWEFSIRTSRLRRADDRVGSRLRGRWRRQRHGIRVEDRQKSLASTSSAPCIRSTGGTTYMVDGRQYFLVPSGGTLTAFALP